MARWARLLSGAHVQDFFVQAVSERGSRAAPKKTTFLAQEQQAIQKAIRSAVRGNGLDFVEETFTDGNCGLDAVLRGWVVLRVNS